MSNIAASNAASALIASSGPPQVLLLQFKCRSFTEKSGKSSLKLYAVSKKNDFTDEQERTSPDMGALARRFAKVAAPYWSSDDKSQARTRLAGVFALTLATTGISVGFNFLGRDFYNALASKDPEQFSKQLLYYLGAFIAGIPVFVFRDYNRDTLSLRWRAWMTNYYLGRYFENRTFYKVQSQSLVDNPDQRIVDDLSSFTTTALSFSLALFNATIDLISFSGILYGIYPPLFGILIIYSIGGTAISVALGKGLVNLNFMQEKREADFRYGLVRVRENAESIAFYSGEKSEMRLLLQRFRQSFDNFSQLLIASRNLEFFQSGYRYLIQVLPAAVIAPLYFSGKIEFGVINQSFSAFNHILGDFSLIIYQFQSLSAFSAVINRLGEFGDVLDQQISNNAESSPAEAVEEITLLDVYDDVQAGTETQLTLLEAENLTLMTPQNNSKLIGDLSLKIHQGQDLLIMGASGCGKTSLLRAIAGLWKCGRGIIKRYHSPSKPEFSNGSALQKQVTVEGDIFFLPQKPYMVLGTLRQQLLYPSCDGNKDPVFPASGNGCEHKGLQVQVSDDELMRVLEEVMMGHLIRRCEDGMESSVEWASVLSLGEQQRLAFARLLLASPRLVLLDEATSALDEESEARLYGKLKGRGITVVSVGHRNTLRRFHSQLLKLEKHEIENESSSSSSCSYWAYEELKQQQL